MTTKSGCLRIAKWCLLLLTGALVVAIATAIVLGLTVTLPAEQSTPANVMRNEARYLAMRDGVRIAVDVWYPADLAAGERVPTVMRSTRYWRAMELGFAYRVLVGFRVAPPVTDADIDFFNTKGYAVVLVDARGSGASFGQRPVEWSDDEVSDLGEVADWIAEQPWSNGNVGTFGVSYDGNTAELAAAAGSKAIKAVAPLYSDFDPLAYLALPGGVFNDGFISDWNRANQCLDKNDLLSAIQLTGAARAVTGLFVVGVKPVDGPDARALRDEAVREHKTLDLYATLRDNPYTDTAFDDKGQTGATISPYARRDAIEKSNVPMYVRASWLDAATIDGALARFKTFRNNQRLTIGAWSHGGNDNADPFLPPDAPPDPSVGGQRAQLEAFFSSALRDGAATWPAPSILYCTLGTSGWRTTAHWPPAGIADRTLYLGSGGVLSDTAPTDEHVEDLYTVDFSATTGETNRWATQLDGRDVVYPDRREEDAELLTYTSGPFPEAMEVTGTPIVTLYVASTEPDGALFVYLEDVAPDGRVTYITEGLLRMTLRTSSASTPPYNAVGIYRRLVKSDFSPLVPGTVKEYVISQFTTSALIAKGHRVRIAIAGHDASTFARIPPSGTPALRIQRSRTQASRIMLPMKPFAVEQAP